MIANEALGHAVTAGDWPLALRAAAVLERQEALPPDARFLLIAQAFRARDWRAAERQIGAIEQEQLFGFAVPVLRAWVRFGSRRGDPLAVLPPPGAGPQSALAAYAGEHRLLLLAATGRADEARRLLDEQGEAGPRALRLRLAAAATLLRRHGRQDALSLLQGEDPRIAAARDLVESRRSLPGAVDSAAAGAAELLSKLALDLYGQDLASVSTSFARLATWLAPDNSQAKMLAAELLARQDHLAAAIDLLDDIGTDDPYAGAARDQRVRLLAESGDVERALGEARDAARAEDAGVDDLVRLGEVLMGRDRPQEAVSAFARALEMRTDSDLAYPEWALWLFRGSAHDEAKDWPAARTALEQAYSLAPAEPLVLNYLGYAQLVRRENMEEAERLIREAHRLAPDNAAITDSLGWALYHKGELAEAIVLLERAAEGEPADVEINEHLGDAYFTAGRRIEARFAWAAARVYAEGEDAERLDAKIERGLTPLLAAR